MNHKTHLYLMVGVAVAAVLLFSTGDAGGWPLYAWLGACAVMMFVMMRGMGGMGGGQGRGGMDGDTTEESTETPRNARHDQHR